MKNLFNWPLNSCVENVQAVQIMPEFAKLFAESLNMENLQLIFEKTSWQSGIMVLKIKHRSNQRESKLCVLAILFLSDLAYALFTR